MFGRSGVSDNSQSRFNLQFKFPTFFSISPARAFKKSASRTYHDFTPDLGNRALFFLDCYLPSL